MFKKLRQSTLSKILKRPIQTFSDEDYHVCDKDNNNNNILYRINILDTTGEKKNTDTEDTAIEIIHNYTERKKKKIKKMNEYSTSELWDNFKQSNVHV